MGVDGFKKDMIEKVKGKGFEQENEMDVLRGEFNGEKVNIFVGSERNKVWRIVVGDGIERKEDDIKIRLNKVQEELKDKGKQVGKLEDKDYICEEINVGYEMKVRKKRFEGGLMEMRNGKSGEK